MCYIACANSQSSESLFTTSKEQILYLSYCSQGCILKKFDELMHSNRVLKTKYYYKE